jgi:formylglycine-generating enzyme required for sulfatase activity
MRLLRIDPGTFMRGTPREELGRRANEPAPERVDITEPYYIGIYEVTQAQYGALMPRSPSYWRGNPSWPIDQVVWADVAGGDGYIARLNRILAAKYGGALVADLPTEDEWENACRAGTQSSFNNGRNISALSSDPALDPLANYNRSETGSPKPVGSFLPNAWGLYDMHGNVMEWCEDKFQRGGNWQSKAAECRAGVRTQGNSEGSRSNKVGFRIVLRYKADKKG